MSPQAVGTRAKNRRPGDLCSSRLVCDGVSVCLQVVGRASEAASEPHRALGRPPGTGAGRRLSPGTGGAGGPPAHGEMKMLVYFRHPGNSEEDRSIVIEAQTVYSLTPRLMLAESQLMMWMPCNMQCKANSECTRRTMNQHLNANHRHPIANCRE